MKDVISILQSRIAKRSNKIHGLRESLCDCHDCVADGSFYDQEEELAQQTKQQKEDKRILAEIVKLRRENKELRTPVYYISPEESFEIVLDKSVDEWAVKFMKDNEEELNRIAMNFVEARLGER